MPNARLLPSGYLHVWFSPECFAQFPPGLLADTLPRSVVFHAEWNYHRVYRWWAGLTLVQRQALWEERRND